MTPTRRPYRDLTDDELIDKIFNPLNDQDWRDINDEIALRDDRHCTQHSKQDSLPEANQ